MNLTEPRPNKLHLQNSSHRPQNIASPKLVNRRSKFGQKSLASVDARPLHKEQDEIGEAPDAGLVEDVADVGAHSVISQSELLCGFARRPALEKQRRDRRFASGEAVEPREQIRVRFRRALRIGKGDRNGVRAAEGRGGVASRGGRKDERPGSRRSCV
jgi:hypothetical protein